MIQTKTIEINGRTYAVGLVWHFPEGDYRPVKNRPLLEAARKWAAEFPDRNYNHTALRLAQSQFGLGHHDGALPPKTMSLAASLQAPKDLFIGVFCLKESPEESIWWVCGISYGNIVVTGDAVFDSKEEAMAAADQLRITTNMEVEITCESPEESLKYLYSILFPKGFMVSFAAEERNQRRMRRGLIGAALILALAIGLYWIYCSYLADQQSLAQSRRQVEIEEKKREILAHPEEYFEAEWRDAPPVAAAGEQCAAALLNLPLSVNAWMLQEAACQPGKTIQTVWKHTRGGSFLALPAGTRLTAPQEAKGSRALPRLPNRAAFSAARPLLTQEQATAALYELVGRLQCQMPPVQWAPPKSYAIDEENSVNAPWIQGTFTLNQLPAAALIGPDFFSALSYPGTTLLSVTQKPNESVSLKGYIHVVSPSR